MSVLYISIILSVMGRFSLVHALTVAHTFEFYSIDPQNVQDVRREIRAKGPELKSLNRGKANAVYNHRLVFFDRLSYRQLKGRCQVTFAEPHLQGTITLFKLLVGKSYAPEIVREYKRRLERSKVHELNHERLYQEGYAELEKSVRVLIEGGPRDCTVLRKHIRAKYDFMRGQIKRKNQEFDCEAYGFHGKEKMCRRFLNTEVQPQSNADGADCAGTLVEAFKGVFYCVTGAHTK